MTKVISDEALFENLFVKDIQLIIKVKNNIKNSQMSDWQDSAEKKPTIDIHLIKARQLALFCLISNLC